MYVTKFLSNIHNLNFGRLSNIDTVWEFNLVIMYTASFMTYVLSWVLSFHINNHCSWNLMSHRIEKFHIWNNPS